MNKEKTILNSCVITEINSEGKMQFINGEPFMESCGDTRTEEKALIDIYIS